MFNEQNTIEDYLINILQKLGWDYKKSEHLKRTNTDIFLVETLRDKIIAINDFDSQQADLILFELQKICLQSEQVGLVSTNEIFARWLRNEMTMPFGENGQHTEVKLIDFENISRNKFQFATQLSYKTSYEKRLDVVLFVNGIPLVVGECKTPVRPAISWVDGAEDIQSYENDISPLFVPNLFSFATEGKTFRYGAVGNAIEHWGTWRAEEDSDLIGLSEVEQSVKLMFEKSTILEILSNFSIFATTKKRKKVKILCRYQQFEAANKMLRQVIENKNTKDNRKGLVWHFQGSGKSLLMVFTAMKLRKQKVLENPTVLIIVDRVDLDTQITATFHASDIPNTVSTDDRKELETLLKQDSRKIIITTIHKFGEMEGVVNDRKNVVALIDEAHRTQEGDLARKMRTALPNAFLFGLTGTPISKKDKNTFANFGGEALYLSKYTYQDAVRDGATLPLHFEARLSNMHVKKEDLDTAFEELTLDLEEREKASLSRKAANLKMWLKSSERVEMIAKDMIKHYQEKILPNRFKAQVVCVDREACMLYKKAFDKILGDEKASAIVMTISGKENDYKKYHLAEDEENQLLDKFRDEKSELKFLIVTNKLLTGFDAPALQVMYLDKTIKDHNLLQAICRTNRTYPHKTHGLIVDYIGVFSDVARAFEFDEPSVKESIKISKNQRMFFLNI